MNATFVKNTLVGKSYLQLTRKSQRENRKSKYLNFV